MRFRVGATLGGWSRELRSHTADHAPDMDVVLVRDQRAAVESDLAVICLDLSTVWVTASLVGQLQTAGVTVVGMFADESEQRQWEAWGVPHRLRVDVAAEHMVVLLETLRPHALSERAPERRVDVASGDEGPGRLVVVGGPSGSGAREVAVGIADRLAGEGSTVVVDCDETGGTLAARVGYGEHPNLLIAVSLVEAGDDVARVVAEPLPGRPRVPFDVIGGIPSAAEWSRVSATGVRRLLWACLERWSTVVAVSGPTVEDLRRWVDRYGVSRDLVGSTAVVVGVCAASRWGVLEFAEWLSQARPAPGGADGRVQVIVNKVPAGSPFVRGEVFEQLRSLCGERIELVGAAPWDRRVVRAEWNAELVRRGPYSRALDGVVDALVLDAAVGAIS